MSAYYSSLSRLEHNLDAKLTENYEKTRLIWQEIDVILARKDAVSKLLAPLLLQVRHLNSGTTYLVEDAARSLESLLTHEKAEFNKKKNNFKKYLEEEMEECHSKINNFANQYQSN